MRETATILLVHGAWHGPWYWATVEAALGARGIPTRTVALPSCGADPVTLGALREDADAVGRAAAAISGNLIIVGHSYGGMVISEAAFGPNARRLVYLCAFMPVEGASLVSHFPALPPFADLRQDGSVAFVKPLARETLYSDCSAEDAAEATARLVLHSATAITTPTSRAAWRAIPSTYIVATEDRIIPVEVQRQFAGQANDRVDLPTGHSPMISRPDLLATAFADMAEAEGWRAAG